MENINELVYNEDWNGLLDILSNDLSQVKEIEFEWLLDTLFTTYLNETDSELTKSLKEIIAIFLKNGFTIDTIPHATLLGDLDRIKFLQDQGHHIDEEFFSRGYTGLIVACVLNNVELVKYFIDNNSDVRCTYHDHREPIDFTDNDEIVSLLRSKGALTKKERDEIEDLFYGAFDHANKIKSGALTGQKIIEAVKANNADEVKRLLNLSADEGGLILLRLIEKDSNGKSALQIAEENKNENIIAILRGRNK